MAVGGAEERDPGKWVVVVAWVTCVLALSAQGAATALPPSSTPVGVSETLIQSPSIGSGFPFPRWPMQAADNFVSVLVSFISHLGSLAWELDGDYSACFVWALVVTRLRLQAELVDLHLSSGAVPSRALPNMLGRGFLGAWSTWHRLKWGGQNTRVLMIQQVVMVILEIIPL